MTGPEQMASLAEDIPQHKMKTIKDEINCRLSSHAIFTIPGVSHFNICQDAMHILFCKGVFSHAMGNALKHWVYHCKFPGCKSVKDRTNMVWGKIRSLYSLYGTENRMPTLKTSMFTSTDRPHQEKPFLKTKAGECKSLVPIFAQLAIDLHQGNSTSDLLVGPFSNMDEFCQLLDSEQRFPSQQKCEEAVLKLANSTMPSTWLLPSHGATQNTLGVSDLKIMLEELQRWLGAAALALRLCNLPRRLLKNTSC